MMTFPFMNTPRLILLVVLALLVPACGAPRDDVSAVRPVYDKQTGQLTELQYDENGNGRIDTWVQLEGTRIIRAQADHDEDGRIDRWEHYRADGEVGKIARIEISTRRDGRVNRTEFFVDDRLEQVHEDTDNDGKADKWETYRGSALAAVAFDMQRRGTPDRRFVYRADGSLERLESDANGDGIFEPVTAARP